MSKILIVEDDSFKAENLASLLNSNIRDVDLSFVSCVASAVRTVQSENFDLIILDMALPSHPVVSGGGSPISLLTGGLEILFELHSLARTDKCVVVTQYPEIEINGVFFPVDKAANAIKSYFSCEVLGCVQYEDEAAEWKRQLLTLIKNDETLIT